MFNGNATVRFSVAVTMTLFLPLSGSFSIFSNRPQRLTARRMMLSRDAANQSPPGR